MIENIVIIILSVLLVLSLRKHCYSFVKRVIGRFFPTKYIRGLKKFFYKNKGNLKKTKDVLEYSRITADCKKRLGRAIRVTFTGDLILLKDMVENGYSYVDNKYNFDSMFKYVHDFYDEADFNIGVFEGPVAGAERGFSTSCFNDGIPLYLNFPREYAEAVKRAGFNLVTLANNHLLDQNVAGMYNTIDELNQIGLEHVGAYRNIKEKQSAVKVFDVCGKKVVILAYTYGSNRYKTDFFFEKEHAHLTSLIVSPKSRFIRQCLAEVKKDFEKAKSLSPDLIIVLPHMGKQFMHTPDDFQLYWCNIFVEYGADIILSDHPHAVQPIEWRRKGDRDVLIVHCPGNFVNSYIARDGDASMIVECYLDADTCRPFAIACIPIYAYARYGRDTLENYTGIPIYKIIEDDTVIPGLSRYEYDRIREVQKLVTKTALGVEIDLDDIQKKYYSIAGVGYVKQ